MAQLPPDGTLLVQQIDGQVVVIHRHTEEEYHRVADPSDQNALGPALQAVWNDDRMTPEQKCLTAFWFGYFYAHA